MEQLIYLCRHGETKWTLSGQHTGRTDLLLTEKGEDQARGLQKRLKSVSFDHVLVSPLKRVEKTCELAGLKDKAVVEPDLLEWDYGSYEGLTTVEIQKKRPGWTIFTGNPPGGETLSEVGQRADSLIKKLRELEGTIALFSSGHFTRILGARWIHAPADAGANFQLDTASLSMLSYEHHVPTIKLWNDTSHIS